MRSLILLLMLVAAALSPGGASAAHGAARTVPTLSAQTDVHRAGATALPAPSCDQRCPAVLPDHGEATTVGYGGAQTFAVDRERLTWSYEPPVPSGVPRDGRT